jgi:23S rRNA (uracil1939-C5)-methyltransferase
VSRDRGSSRSSRAAGGDRGGDAASTAETRELAVTVDSIAAGGDGVARADGLVVFLPRTAPGDSGVAQATVGRSFARGRLTTLERASPFRIDPPCPHYVQDDCGGCQLQHMEYVAQLEAKRRIVEDAFVRIGRTVVEVPPVEPSPEQWRYRAKLTLALRRRTPGEPVPDDGIAPPGSRWIAGLRPFDDPAKVFPLRDCLISSERLLDTWRSVLRVGDLLPDAPALRVAARLTSEGAALVVQGGEDWGTAEDFASAVENVSELWWAGDTGDPVLLRGKPADVVAELPGDSLDVEPGASFVQVNPEVAEAVRSYVLQLAMAKAPRTAVDAYSGTGAYASRLAASGVRVTAIERDPAAAAFASRTLPPPSLSVAASVERALPDALPADLVIVNPPRGGLHARVAEFLAAGGERPSHLIYVSCNPATLARDVARLAGWQVDSVRAFDMFPQTAHVEVVCELVREE